MKNFKKGGFGRREGGFNGGRPSFGGDRRQGGNKFGGGRDRGEGRFGGVELFETTCSKCGKSCEVPFRPTGEKPVYCNDCFIKNKGDTPRSFDRRGDHGKTFERHDARPQQGSNDEVKKKLLAIENKLDQLLQLLRTETTEISQDTNIAPKRSEESIAKKQTVVTETKKSKEKKASPAKKAVKSKKK